MTEPLGAVGTPAGLGEEAEEVLVEVFHEDQGLSPKVDFCFFKQVVFHLSPMKKPKVNLTGDADWPQSRAESWQMQKQCVPSPPDRGLTLACQHPCTHSTCTLEGHLLSSLVLLHWREIFFPQT